MRMIDMLFRSACLFHRKATCTLLTDKATSVYGVGRAFTRMDSAVDHSSLMLSRSLAQLERVEVSDFSHPLVLIDSDILVNGSLNSLFHQDFDVALTWRLNKSMPINGGLMILNNRRPEVVRDFFRRFVAIYRRQYLDQGQWFGDQLALRDVVGLSHGALSRSHIMTIRGCRMLMLPCDTYNFSPECSFPSIMKSLDDKVILHFKGPRKKLMEPYWLAYLQPKELFWPQAHIAGVRARRRLRHLIAQTSEESSDAINDED